MQNDLVVCGVITDGPCSRSVARVGCQTPTCSTSCVSQNESRRPEHPINDGPSWGLSPAPPVLDSFPPWQHPRQKSEQIRKSFCIFIVYCCHWLSLKVMAPRIALPSCRFVLFACVLALECATTGGQLANSTWPMFGKNARHSSFSEVIGSQTGSVRWRRSYRGGISPPAIGADGTMYVPSFQQPLLAINSLTSNTKPSFTTNAVDASSTPAIGLDGYVYFGSSYGRIYAVDKDTGSGAPRWFFQTDTRLGQ